ncbi:hypothetical protein A9G25_06945 [Gilliamella sp. Bif1-4]|jgi:hypothetical protein|nr:hypothetical protein A9G25_06945 [Gilliamella apicola]
MDFMSDSSRNQRRFRTFNVIDDFNREALGIDIAVNLLKPGSPPIKMAILNDLIVPILLKYSIYIFLTT